MRFDSKVSARFYDSLSSGRVKRGIWGLESRFDTAKIIESPSVDRHFRQVVRRFATPGRRVLDVGCGPGAFTAILAETAGDVVGVDVSEEWVARAERTFAERKVPARAVVGSAGALPFDRESFDVVTFVDVLHHLEAPAPALSEAARVLRPGGTLLVFEPNKLNPVLTLLCVLDRNEWGFLRPGMGRFAGYERMLEPAFHIEEQRYSGLLVGPDGPTARRIADGLSEGHAAHRLSWLSPKLFVRATKK